LIGSLTLPPTGSRQNEYIRYISDHECYLKKR
jgi:hypothetical protein